MIIREYLKDKKRMYFDDTKDKIKEQEVKQLDSIFSQLANIGKGDI